MIGKNYGCKNGGWDLDVTKNLYRQIVRVENKCNQYLFCPGGLNVIARDFFHHLLVLGIVLCMGWSIEPDSSFVHTDYMLQTKQKKIFQFFNKFPVDFNWNHPHSHIYITRKFDSKWNYFICDLNLNVHGQQFLAYLCIKPRPIIQKLMVPIYQCRQNSPWFPRSFGSSRGNIRTALWELESAYAYRINQFDGILSAPVWRASFCL